MHGTSTANRTHGDHGTHDADADADALVVDWGTTSLRGYRLRAGTVLAQASSEDGTGRLSPADYPGRLARLLEELGATSGLVVVAGMAGSAGGWTEVPCVPLPADAASLSRGVVHLPRDVVGEELAAFDVCLVPGVADVHDGRLRDLMRGEEVEFLGAGAGDGVAVFPGSHSKWVRGEGGSIVGLTTYLTGEAYTALGRHTLLSRSLPDDLRVDDDRLEDFVAGVDASAEDLLHGLFAVRVQGLGGAAPEACAAWLSGLLVGSEVRSGLRWAGTPRHVGVGGAETLQRLYRTALEHLGTGVDLLPPLAAARGSALVSRLLQRPEGRR